jgi:hypothetical protein
VERPNGWKRNKKRKMKTPKANAFRRDAGPMLAKR